MKNLKKVVGEKVSLREQSKVYQLNWNKEISK